MKRHFCAMCGGKIPDTKGRFIWANSNENGMLLETRAVCKGCNKLLTNVIRETIKKPRRWNMPDLGFLGWFTERPMRIPFTFLAVVVALTLLNNFIWG